MTVHGIGDGRPVTGVETDVDAPSLEPGDGHVPPFENPLRSPKHVHAPSAKASEMQRRLVSLARRLLPTPRGQRPLRIEIGENRGYDPKTQVLRVRLADLENKSDLYNLGVLVRHMASIGYSPTPISGPSPTRMFFDGVVEEARTGAIYAARYRGASELYGAVYKDWGLTDPGNPGDLVPGPLLPRSLQFANAILLHGAREFPWFVTDPETQSEIQRLAPILDRALGLPDGVDLRFEDLSTGQKRTLALEARECVETHLFPVFSALLQKDIEEGWEGEEGDEKEGSGGDGNSGGEGQEGGLGELKSETADSRGSAGDRAGVLERRMEELLEQLDARKLIKPHENGEGALDGLEHGPPTGGDRPDLQDGGIVTPAATETPRSAGLATVDAIGDRLGYVERVRRLAPLIEPTEGALGNFLIRRSFAKPRGPLKSEGEIFDDEAFAQSYLRFLGTGVSDPDFYRDCPRTEDRKKDLVLCVDRSVSMKDHGKLEAAKDALSLFLEVLGAIHVPHGVVSFCGEVKTLKPIGERASDLEAQAILDDLSVALYTNDTGALECAIALEAPSMGGQRVVVFLTDGGNRPDEMRRKVEEAESAGALVIGIGIGPEGILLVEKAFRHHVVVERVEALPEALDRLLSEIL